jgi:hypothetical protein
MVCVRSARTTAGKSAPRGRAQSHSPHVSGGMLDRVIGRFDRRCACVCVCAIAAMALAGLMGAVPVALAVTGGGGSSFTELTKGGNETTTAAAKPKTVSTATESATSSGGISSSVLLLTVGAAVVLIGGIAFVILRDARSVAPVGDGPLHGGRSGRDPAVTLRKRRAKAKAARRQRKRTR